nr:hemerythrin domain-containing protein [Rhodococcus wratislaviensis]
MRIVHNALRRDIARSAQVLRTAPPPAQTQRVALADHLVWMMHFLHLHHSGKDRGLWPLVRELNPDAGALLDAMDADHARIRPEMERVTAAATEYRVHPTAREGLSHALAALEQVLLPHLQCEEDEMMPVVARTLTRRRWDDVEEQVFIASKTKRELGIEAHWIVDGVDREDYDVPPAALALRTPPAAAPGHAAADAAESRGAAAAGTRRRAHRVPAPNGLGSIGLRAGAHVRCLIGVCGVDLRYGSTTDQGRTGREDSTSRSWRPARVVGTHAKARPTNWTQRGGLASGRGDARRRGHI